VYCQPRSRGCGTLGYGSQTFKIILIKPSHYDRDGYVIQWHRSGIPSNSLASVHGLLTECAEQQVLGPDVVIDIEGYDECNTIIDIQAAVRKIRAAGAGFVGIGRPALIHLPSADAFAPRRG
jgi:hypothetical protein